MPLYKLRASGPLSVNDPNSAEPAKQFAASADSTQPAASTASRRTMPTLGPGYGVIHR